MPSIERLLNNVRQNSKMRKILSAIDRKFPDAQSCAKTPIPNQAFPPLLNKQQRPATLHFTKYAHDILQYIRYFDHKVSVSRLVNNVKTQQNPINFVCFGYKDSISGDLVIEDIYCPILEKLKKFSFKSLQEQINYIASSKPSKETNTDIQSVFYEYLRATKIPLDHKEKEALVALIGTTKPSNTNSPETTNCFSLSEIAKAVMPEFKVNEDIISGVLAVTPKTIQFPYMYQDDLEKNLIDGSLESLIITYNKNPKTSKVKPTMLSNITECQTQLNAKSHKIKISSSAQPLDELYDTVSFYEKTR
ncbi:MAG: hypothetical protein IJW59_03605 [Clostridia bacterium]|nr:hypothetical protein [Clostridia bacterium]